MMCWKMEVLDYGPFTSHLNPETRQQVKGPSALRQQTYEIDNALSCSTEGCKWILAKQIQNITNCCGITLDRLVCHAERVITYLVAFCHVMLGYVLWI